jgi:hypothetical protein
MKTQLYFTIGFKAFCGSVDRLTSILTRKKATDTLHLHVGHPEDDARVLMAVSGDGGITHAIEWSDYASIRTEGSLEVPIKPLIAAMEVFKTVGTTELTVRGDLLVIDWDEETEDGKFIHHEPKYGITFISESTASVRIDAIGPSSHDRKLVDTDGKGTIIYSGSKAEFSDLFGLASLTACKPNGDTELGYYKGLLSHVKVERSEVNLTVLSTDEHRITKVVRSDLGWKQTICDRELVPGSLLRDYFRISDKISDSEPVTLEKASNGDFIIRITSLFSLRVTASDVDIDRYPDVDRYSPRGRGAQMFSATMDRSSLLEAAKKCLTLAKKQDTNGLLLIEWVRFAGKVEMTVFARDPKGKNCLDGVSWEPLSITEIPCDSIEMPPLLDGESVRIALQACYLQDGLTYLKSDRVKMLMSTEISPTYWEPVGTDTGLAYVLMPCRPR